MLPLHHGNITSRFDRKADIRLCCAVHVAACGHGDVLSCPSQYRHDGCATADPVGLGFWATSYARPYVPSNIQRNRRPACDARKHGIMAEEAPRVQGGMDGKVRRTMVLEIASSTGRAAIGTDSLGHPLPQPHLALDAKPLFCLPPRLRTDLLSCTGQDAAMHYGARPCRSTCIVGFMLLASPILTTSDVHFRWLHVKTDC